MNPCENNIVFKYPSTFTNIVELYNSTSSKYSLVSLLNNKITILPKHKVPMIFDIPKRKEKHLSINVKSKDEYQNILEEMNDIFS